MARTTRTDMLEIASFTTEDVDAMIEMANYLIEREVAPYTSMDSEGLTKLETLLAVHFVIVKEGSINQESVSGPGGAVQRSFVQPVGKYLDATVYGQHAMVLDDTGRLQMLNSGKGRQVGLRSVEIYNKEPYGEYG